MPETPDPTPRLPLSPQVLHILLALADRDRHGYAIMREIETRTEGEVQLGPGTLYGAIKRMLRDGLVREADERPDPELDDARRRYYSLTHLGRGVAVAEIGRLQNTVRAAAKKGLVPERAGH